MQGRGKQIEINEKNLHDQKELLKLLVASTPHEIKSIIEKHFQPGSELYKHYEFWSNQHKRFNSHNGGYFACFALMTNQINSFFRFPELYLHYIEAAKKHVRQLLELPEGANNQVTQFLDNIAYLIKHREDNKDADEKIRKSKYAARIARLRDEPIPEIFQPMVFDANQLTDGIYNNFQGLDFSGFDFSGYDLSASRLDECNFTDANLSGCNLDQQRPQLAFMQRTNLSDASLHQTDLTKSWVCDVDFTGVDLSTVKFLEPAERQQELLIASTLFEELNSASADKVLRVISEEFHPDSFNYSVYAGLIESYKKIDHIPDELYLCFALMTENIHQLDFERLNMAIERTTSLSPHLKKSLRSTAHIVEHRQRHGMYREFNYKFDREYLEQNCYINLQGASFRGLDLTGIDFRKFNIRNASFVDGKLNFCDFSGMDMSTLYLHYAVLDQANLSNCNFAGIFHIRGASFFCADLTGVNLTNVDIEGGDFRGADLRHANLTATEFNGVKAQHADFRLAKLDNTRFQEQHDGYDYCDLSHANFTGTDLSTAYIRSGGNLAKNLTGTIFRHANLSGDIAEHYDFSSPNTDFSYANLRGMKPWFAPENCIFHGANLTDADLKHSRFINCDLSGANLTGTQFRRDYFSGEIFEGCDLTRADFSGTTWDVPLKDNHGISFFANIPLSPPVLDLYLTYLNSMLDTLHYNHGADKGKALLCTSLASELKNKADQLEPAARVDVLKTAYQHTLFRGKRMTPSIPGKRVQYEDNNNNPAGSIDRELFESEAQRILLK